MKRKNVVIAGLVFALPMLICSILYLNQLSHNDDWKKRTTPLSTETIDLLCSNFGLPEDNSLCNDSHVVYGLDFFPVIKDTFRPFEAYEIESSEAATYNEVERKIGMFKYECESVVYLADGTAYFRCFYDLRGDREFILAFFYTYPEMAVMRITSTSRYDD